VQHRRTSGRERIASFPECVVLIAAAADSANGTAVGKDEHLRARALRRGPARANDRHQRDRFAALQRVCRCRQHFFVQTSTSIRLLSFSDLMNPSTRSFFFCSVRNCFNWSLTVSIGTADAGFRSVSLMM
jgi:hypothetical protein